MEVLPLSLHSKNIVLRTPPHRLRDVAPFYEVYVILITEKYLRECDCIPFKYTDLCSNKT